jgi:RES domain-containing protein
MARHLQQGGRFTRVADPAWADPLDPSYARRKGGRWNPPQSFGVVYLCADVATARANVARLFAGLPYGPEDLEPDRAPQLVEVDLTTESYVDAVTNAGLRALQLPTSYPVEPDGTSVPHRVCQPIGQRLYDAGELGIASRSAAPGASHGRELSWFAQPDRPALIVHARRRFETWYFASPH